MKLSTSALSETPSARARNASWAWTDLGTRDELARGDTAAVGLWHGK